MFNANVSEALRISAWGSDYHLFAMALLLNRPIFVYNTHHNCDLDEITTVQQLAQIFLSFDRRSRAHCSGTACAVPVCRECIGVGR